MCIFDKTNKSRHEYRDLLVEVFVSNEMENIGRICLIIADYAFIRGKGYGYMNQGYLIGP